MGTIYVRTNPFIARVGTTRLITIATSGTAVVVTSGYTGMAVFNVGPSALVWGDSSTAASSGGLLYYSMQKEWYAVNDSFAVFFRATSVAGTLVVNEYI